MHKTWFSGCMKAYYNENWQKKIHMVKREQKNEQFYECEGDTREWITKVIHVMWAHESEWTKSNAEKINFYEYLFGFSNACQHLMLKLINCFPNHQLSKKNGNAIKHMVHAAAELCGSVTIDWSTRASEPHVRYNVSRMLYLLLSNTMRLLSHT